MISFKIKPHWPFEYVKVCCGCCFTAIVLKPFNSLKRKINAQCEITQLLLPLTSKVARKNEAGLALHQVSCCENIQEKPVLVAQKSHTLAALVFDRATISAHFSTAIFLLSHFLRNLCQQLLGWKIKDLTITLQL